ncbi:MAG: LacI family transcriptional regulator [Fimbriimonadaceae bacterium]|jgi:DNA-binding LacI/PurR family transcriptional regulator|nr:LacI family transcriptional regulator [Fimbriimonadaceae bacterium]
MTASIKDIARKVGVSVSTVSYALNNGPKPVAPQLKQRILDAAKDLDYYPRHLARSLKRKKSDVIGFIHSHMTFDIMRSPAIHEVIVGISNACQEQGKDLLIYTHSDRLEDQGLLSMILDGRVDGVIIFAPENQEEIFQTLDRRNFPYAILLGETSEDRFCYSVDNRHGVEMAVNHLANLGHTKIGHITGRLSLYDGLERDRAFKDALRDRNLPVVDHWVQSGNFEYQVSYSVALDMLQLPDKPTAIFASNDVMARATIDAARTLGLSVPTDLSVVGFDDTEVPNLGAPALTTVRQPLENLGRKALEAVVQIAEGNSVPRPELIQTTLIVRESTAPTKEPI